MEDLRKNVNLLYELGTLRNVDRTWKQFHIYDTTNVAEHTLMVQLVALMIARMEGIEDESRLGKIAMMALSHDFAECRTGDVHFISREYVKRDEAGAIQDMFEGTNLKEVLVPLVMESEHRETLEAKIVKDADNLSVDLEIQEMRMRGMKNVETFMETRKYVCENKLFTKSGKKLWQEIYATDAAEWIMKAKNRYNSGDWSQKA